MIRTFRLGAVSSSVVNAIADAITTEEGYYPGSLAWRNNNPGNLIYVGQAGAVLGEGGFAKYPTAAAGRGALVYQINLDLERGTDANGNPTTTIAELISSWAPASAGNNPAVYAANVSAAVGIDANTPLDGAAAGDFAGNILTAGVGSIFSDTVDLSAVGLPSSVPVAAVAGVSLLLLLAFSRR